VETATRREIPYNYTSADDEQVVRWLFGPALWRALERLRSQRVTGRSAKLLMRFIGDLFVLKRNPFLYAELSSSAARRRGFLRAAAADLDIVRRNSAGNRRVLVIIRRCQESLKALERELTAAPARQARIRRALGAVVGEGNVHFDPFTLVSHATDATDWRLHLPLAVASPSRESEVAPLLKAIADLDLHAIPRGAGTGLTGGAVPLREGCVMVNTERLDRIRGLEEVELPDGSGRKRPVAVLEAEAGVVTEDAIRAAESRGLVFATDPTSAWACTVGGNLAENAGGKTAVLWGTAIDNVLSWRLATPKGGDLLVERVGHPLRKILPDDEVTFLVKDAATGGLLRTVELQGAEIRKRGLWKDITNKALGGLPGLQKEGTDGVITSARFVLHPAYPHKATACLEFYGEDMDEASRVIWDLSRVFVDRGEEALMALEHFDEEYVRAIDYKRKAARPGRPKAVLLIDMVAHNPAQLARGRRRLETLLKPHRNTHVFFAKDAKEAADFWKDRKKLGAIAKRTNAFKLNEDTVLPLSALADFARHVDAVNVEEERHNQLRFVAAVQDHLSKASFGEDAAWITPKLPAARERAERARKALAKAAKKALREEVHVRELRDGLTELFAGYGTLGRDIEQLYADTRSRLIVIATHMHAGDGNVHVNIPVFSNDREMMRRAADTADRIMEKVRSLGGVVSGEHGIGITKLRHLEEDKRQALERYRRSADPGGLMNPGKLSDLASLDLVFTPSFNLLELEARILQHGSLEQLADMISKCVRCGRCKPDCCVFYPARNLYYHPRNKNLAVGSLIEALLYDAQRFRSTEFEALRYLEEVADHCTICHKCLKPCPVDIDTGRVSVLEREILASRRYKHTAPLTGLTLRYLASRSRAFNALFRTVVLRVGGLAQRLGALLLAPLPRLTSQGGPLGLLKSPVPPVPAGTMGDLLPRCREDQALLLPPPRPNGRSVFYFPGCGSERLHSDVGLASLYILLKAGTRVVLPPPFLCCGFPLHVNARTADHDRKVLSDTILFSQIREMFSYLDFDAVAVSCGTCREALEGMDAPGIFKAPLADVSRFALENGLPRPPAGPYLYHKPCHDSLQDRAVEVLGKSGLALETVPHCCSEAGTLSLSRPDITGKMLDRKAEALHSAVAAGRQGRTLLTNCPSCIQGLGRNEAIGYRTRHIAVELAERTGGREWKKELKGMLRKAEVVNI
jgi:FAD/FMN-containing dehydrogenase/Fe-S oxidoreductase